VTVGHLQKSFDRRAFLRATAASTVAIAAATVTGAAATSASAAAPGRLPIPKDRISLQLYSVRDKITSMGFGFVLPELAKIGYNEVEFAGYTQNTSILGRQITIQEIRQILDDNGLKAVGSHIGIGDFQNNLEGSLDIAETLGMPHVGTANAPSGTNTVAAYKAAADSFNEWGRAATARGLKLYQHNHSGEFAFAKDQPAVRLYDVFLRNTDPRYVYLEMDVYWAFVGQYRYPGFEPAAYVRDQPYRYPLFHMKDGVSDTKTGDGWDMVEFGAGNMPYEKFVRDIGGRDSHIGIWEQDNAVDTKPNPPGSLGAAERSYAGLKALIG
jgi:sugar phosphate isomerase/epimerase